MEMGGESFKNLESGHPYCLVPEYTMAVMSRGRTTHSLLQDCPCLRQSNNKVRTKQMV